MTCQATGVAMVKTWSADNPKAALMARAGRDRRRRASGLSRRGLRGGVGQRHRRLGGRVDQDPLSALREQGRAVRRRDAGGVRQPARLRGLIRRRLRQADPTYVRTPAEALPAAGAEYLRSVLSPDQLALYRVVTRDCSPRPELGRRYHEEDHGHPVMPSSRAMSTCGRSGRAGRSATSGPPHRYSPAC